MENEKKKFKRRRWHATFLENLSKFGTVTAACSASGVSRATAYRELVFTEFAAMAQDSHRQYRDMLHLKVVSIAMKEGSPSQVSLQALQYLIGRADKRLNESDRAG